MSKFTITKNEKLAGSLVVIEGTISVSEIESYKKVALDKFQSRINLDGFRAGHIPEKKLIEVVGELAIFEEETSLALEKNYSDIITESKIHPIGSPKVSITKISIGAPAEFKIETSVLPEVKLPNYKKIAVEAVDKKEEIKIEDKEVKEALEEIRRNMAHFEKHHSAENQPAEGEGHDHHDHSGKDIPEEELPKLDDEFAKKVGKFETLKELEDKIKEGITNEKQVRAKEKNRLTIIEKIIEKTEVEVPEILITSEQQKMLAEMKVNIERMGIGYDEYLVHIKKSEEELKAEWLEQATKRVKMELIINQIAIKEEIKATEEEIQKEAKVILDTYKEADPIRVNGYVEEMLITEKVWLFLETQK